MKKFKLAFGALTICIMMTGCATDQDTSANPGAMTDCNSSADGASKCEEMGKGDSGMMKEMDCGDEGAKEGCDEMKKDAKGECPSMGGANPAVLGDDKEDCPSGKECDMKECDMEGKEGCPEASKDHCKNGDKENCPHGG